MTLAPLVDIRLIDGPVDSVPLTPFPPSCGAECVFLGRTREEHHSKHGALVHLDYDTYDAMAIARLREIAERAMEQHDVVAVRIHHARGVVPVGGASVLIQVATGHRAASFESCRSIIDQLKLHVPIWKQEYWSDGTTWSEGTPLTNSGPGETS